MYTHQTAYRLNWQVSIRGAYQKGKIHFAKRKRGVKRLNVMAKDNKGNPLKGME